ncbi:MAG: class I tRNA ligase family protein, partial [Dehalococcoidia bacterium]|nr:class I tRNA ligase family protein [Dehalococcoidia bacterium]
PWDQGGEWSDSGINGMARWMNRVWELAQRDTRVLDDLPSDDEAVRDLQRLVHQTVRRAGDDLERFKFNTALAALMEYTNSLNQAWERKGVSSDGWNDAIEKLLLMMAPLAPHMAEELWERTGNAYSVHQRSWPEWDQALAADEVFTLVVQVNGRLRDRIDLPVSATEDEAREAALSSQRVTPHI